MFRVLLIDDQGLFREMARETLESEGDFQVVAEAGDGSEALHLVEKVSPDLVLMDVYMPGMNGFEATREILDHHPQAKVVLISTSRDREHVKMGRRVGALAFMAKKDLTADSLRRVLQAAA